MYSYKQIADSNNINMIKKTYGKFLIPIIFTMVSSCEYNINSVILSCY